MGAARLKRVMDRLRDDPDALASDSEWLTLMVIAWRVPEKSDYLTAGMLKLGKWLGQKSQSTAWNRAQRLVERGVLLRPEMMSDGGRGKTVAYRVVPDGKPPADGENTSHPERNVSEGEKHSAQDGKQRPTPEGETFDAGPNTTFRAAPNQGSSEGSHNEEARDDDVDSSSPSKGSSSTSAGESDESNVVPFRRHRCPKCNGLIVPPIEELSDRGETLHRCSTCGTKFGMVHDEDALADWLRSQAETARGEEAEQ